MIAAAWSITAGSAAVASARASGVLPADTGTSGASTIPASGAERELALPFAAYAGDATAHVLIAIALS